MGRLFVMVLVLFLVLSPYFLFWVVYHGFRPVVIVPSREGLLWEGFEYVGGGRVVVISPPSYRVVGLLLLSSRWVDRVGSLLVFNTSFIDDGLLVYLRSNGDCNITGSILESIVPFSGEYESLISGDCRVLRLLVSSSESSVVLVLPLVDWIFSNYNLTTGCFRFNDTFKYS